MDTGAKVRGLKVPHCEARKSRAYDIAIKALLLGLWPNWSRGCIRLP